MSRRLRSRGHAGYGYAGAVLLVLLWALLCGGVAAWTPVPDAVAGFGFACLVVVVVGGVRPRRARHRR